MSDRLQLYREHWVAVYLGLSTIVRTIMMGFDVLSRRAHGVKLMHRGAVLVLRDALFALVLLITYDSYTCSMRTCVAVSDSCCMCLLSL